LHQALIVEKIYIRKTFVLAQNRLWIRDQIRLL
jgi:hypothetical protein